MFTADAVSLFTSYILLWVFLSRGCYILILEIVVVHNMSILLIKHFVKK
jgi:hypothetical protein